MTIFKSRYMDTLAEVFMSTFLFLRYHLRVSDSLS